MASPPGPPPGELGDGRPLGSPVPPGELKGDSKDNSGPGE